MEPRKLMGFETPGDQRIPIPVRDWNGLKLALWRSRAAWEIAEREAIDIINRCKHTEGCPAILSETAPCLSDLYEPQKTDAEGNVTAQAVRISEGCPDREQRMSALVILSAARMFAPVDARRPAAEPYMAPSREYFSEVTAELAIKQIECAALHEALRAAGVEAPLPPQRPESREPPQLTTEERLEEVQ